MTFPHVVFDGCGIATVLRIIQAELSGKAWEVPFPIFEGDNRNLLEDAFLDAEKEKEETKDTTWQHASVYRGFH